MEKEFSKFKVKMVVTEVSVEEHYVYAADKDEAMAKATERFSGRKDCSYREGEIDGGRGVINRKEKFEVEQVTLAA